jgi:hypothetical protein
MLGAFESEAVPLFHTELLNAKKAAIQEAAITYALVQEVISVMISKDHINFVGKIRRGHLEPRLPNPIDINIPYLLIKTSSVGNFHTIWKNIYDNVTILGYLVFMLPVEILYQGQTYGGDYDSDNNIIIKIQLTRLGQTLCQRTIGPSICLNCGKIIAPERLLAVPGTHYCTQCMIIIEKKEHNYGKSF